MMNTVLLAVTLSIALASNVIVLDQASFDSTITQHDQMLVEFYAPWCGHCKKLAPVYEQVADWAADANDVKLAKVDCTTESEVCSKFGVKGYPTLKWFDHGSPTDYSGGRDVAGIKSYITLKTAPVIVAVTSNDEFDALTGSVVAFAHLDESTDNFAFFKSASEAMREKDVTFAYTTDASIASHAGLGDAILRVTISSSGSSESWQGAELSSTADIVTFVNDNSLPLLDEMTAQNYKTYMGRSLPIVWTFVSQANFPKDGEFSGFLAHVHDIAAEHKGSMSFVYVDGDKMKKHRNSLGHEGSLPAVVVENIVARKKYIFDDASGALDASSLRQYLSDYSAGNLVEFLKSEEAPASNDGPVTVVVGTTFSDIVYDSTKNVLVEFYAPWCSHCKSLAPIYEELGTAFSDDDSVIIAKVDATANDTPEEVKGFPTLVFYPATESKKGIKYTQDRSLDAMKKYINNNKVVSSSEDAAGAKDEL